MYNVVVVNMNIVIIFQPFHLGTQVRYPFFYMSVGLYLRVREVQTNVK